MCEQPAWHMWIFDTVTDPENYICPVCQINIEEAHGKTQTQDRIGQ